MIYVDLVLDNNQLVRVEAPSKVADELFEELEASMKQQSTWSPLMFEGCTATLNGLRLSKVFMNRVVGILS